MKKKIYKIISLVAVIILVVSCFCITASAKTVFNNANDFFGITLSSLNLYKSSSGGFVNVTGSQSMSAVGNDFYYTMTSTESWGAGQKYRIKMSGDVLFSGYSFNDIYSGSFAIVGNPTLYNILLSSSSVYFTNTDGTKTYCSLSLSGASNQDLVCSFNSGSPKVPEFFSISFDFTNIKSISASNTVVDFSIMSLNFQILSDSDIIVESNNKLSSDIQANADKNANEIKANQDKNANKIINGGRDEPGYSSTDKTATNNYQAMEEEIDNQTASARSSTVNFFNNFGGLLNDTPVSGGLLAVSKIMTEFFNIGWLSGLIQFALGIGAFAFILGSVIMVVGKVSSNNRASARSEYFNSKSAYFKAKSDYFNSRRRK